MSNFPLRSVKIITYVFDCFFFQRRTWQSSSPDALYLYTWKQARPASHYRYEARTTHVVWNNSMSWRRADPLARQLNGYCLTKANSQQRTSKGKKNETLPFSVEIKDIYRVGAMFRWTHIYRFGSSQTELHFIIKSNTSYLRTWHCESWLLCGYCHALSALRENSLKYLNLLFLFYLITTLLLP